MPKRKRTAKSVKATKSVPVLAPVDPAIETLQQGDGDGKKFDVTWKHKHNCVDGEDT
ncbi:hypothetical protein SESBI_20020 [Sesbania bispinosa]|nr:hypothetical protein SESBI_20020 [Sesbania bispinosa]